MVTFFLEGSNPVPRGEWELHRCWCDLCCCHNEGDCLAPATAVFDNDIARHGSKARDLDKMCAICWELIGTNAI